jgi:ABC-type glycerol-3-phosphate transport system substrate-binding protein
MKRVLVVTFALLIVAGAAFAAGQSEQKTITLTCAIHIPDIPEKFGEILDIFAKEHPNIKIDYTTT